MTAEAVKPEAISLPKVAGQHRLPDCLPPERAQVARDLKVLELHPSLMPYATVRACHRISESDELVFARRMLDCGMAELVEEGSIYRHPQSGRMMVAGLFAVFHKAGRQRLIVDRRARLCLPHSAQLSEVALAPSKGLRVSSDDLECWFYQLRHEGDWCLRQAVGRRLFGDQFADYGADATKRYRLCISVVATGDHNGCAFAQSAHEEFLQRGGLLPPSRTMRYGLAPPVGNLWEGVYIDDHLLCQRLGLDRLACLPNCQCKKCARAPPEYIAAVAALGANYECQGVHQSAGKRVRFSTHVDVWGAHVRGRKGRLAVAVDKRRQICRLCISTVRQGYATEAILRGLVGASRIPFFCGGRSCQYLAKCTFSSTH